MSRRATTAVVVLLLWLVGVAALAHRELFQDQASRLAHAARLVAPGAVYYAAMRHGSQSGFASSTIDTSAAGIEIEELQFVQHRVRGTVRRTETRTTVHLGRALELRGFRREIQTGGAPVVIDGTMHGDSTLTISQRVGDGAARTHRFAVTGPVLVPEEVPLAIGLAGSPSIGRRYHFTMVDMRHLALGPATMRVTAESLFVVSDSAALDASRTRWVPAHEDTVKAWYVEQEGNGVRGGPADGWIDAQGHVIQTRRPSGLMLRQSAYELAFENWRAQMERASHPDPAMMADRPQSDTTAAHGRAARHPSTMQPEPRP
ncbi:MAG TPA: hypothetical protein VFW98_03620 [Gemmatimonadaceae bacterium]|nr:hypothetical protein [Gemmatimonadaceae bacterium]